ncbi:hypothetical protein ACEPAF_2106 [Sanghuangporus sanghuang]
MEQDPDDDGVFYGEKSLPQLLEPIGAVHSFGWYKADEDAEIEMGFHPNNLKGEASPETIRKAAIKRGKQVNIIERETTIPEDTQMEYAETSEQPMTPPSPFLKKAM